MPGPRESEVISCPYCGDTFTRRSNGAFRTAELTPDAEEGWIEERHKVLCSKLKKSAHDFRTNERRVFGHPPYAPGAAWG